MKKAIKWNEEGNFWNLKMLEFVKVTIFYSLEFSLFLLFNFTIVYISKMDFKLLSISSV